ncbi:MAG TPA: hypothetical protein VMS09_13335 [Paenibacillus sp.]|nr:hypothetical protein [Paenibacillus sp.]HUC92986.1 hypothetical protein [Paenibacillus sp.]
MGSFLQEHGQNAQLPAAVLEGYAPNAYRSEEPVSDVAKFSIVNTEKRG